MSHNDRFPVALLRSPWPCGHARGRGILLTMRKFLLALLCERMVTSFYLTRRLRNAQIHFVD